MEPSKPRSLFPLSKNLDPHSDVLHVLDDRGKLLRSGDPVRGADGYDRSPAPADQYRLSNLAESRRVRPSGGPVLACSKSCDHEYLDHPGCFPDMGVRDDVAGRPGRSGDFIHERGRGGARLARCAPTGGSTNLNVQTDVRSYSSTRGTSFACEALW